MIRPNIELAVWKIGARVRFFVMLSLVVWANFSVAHSQSSANITVDHGEVTAGDTVTMMLTFDQPAPCSAGLYLELRENSGSVGIALRGNVEAGKNTAAVAAAVPKDVSGTFKTASLTLYPCDGYSQGRTLEVPKVMLNVKALPDKNKYPAKVTIALSLTQKQFLGTRETELGDLAGQIDARIEEDGRDSTEMRAFLTRIVESAEAALQLTEHEYATEILKPKDTLPTFFEDFERQYAHLRVELKAPIPGTRASFAEPSGFMRVKGQLNRRPPAPPTAKGRNLSGTSPAIAKAVKQTIDDNASAYAIVSSTGRARFYAQFSSLPNGATIYYRQAILPDFKVWPTTTDIPVADFDLATTIFKFHKDECLDEPVRTVDPYDDTHPVISVEFKRCPKK